MSEVKQQAGDGAPAPGRRRRRPTLRDQVEQLQRELAEQRALFAATGAQVAALCVAADGRILAASDAFVSRFGGCEGRSVHDWATAGDFADCWQSVLQGAPAVLKLQAATADGGHADLEVTLVPVPGGDGTVSAVSLYCRAPAPADMPAGAPEDAQPAEAAAAGTIPSVLDAAAAVARYDHDGRILEASMPFASALGFDSPDALAGRAHEELLQADPQGPDHAGLWAAALAGRHDAGICAYRSRDGARVFLRSVFAPLEAAGAPAGVVQYAMDVTELHRAALAAAQEIDAIGTNLAAIYFDPDGNILDYNDTFAAAMGYPRGEAVGRHHSIFCVGDYANTQEYRDFWESLRRGVPSIGEVHRRKRDGSEIWLRAVYAPIFDENGRVARVVKHAMDVTEQKTTQQLVEQLISDCATVIRGMSRGDLGARIEQQYRGEFGDLVAMLNETNEKLADTMSRIRHSVDVISENAHSLTDGNLALTQRTEEQASSLEETAASMEQMTATVKQNAESAQQAKCLASEASQKARDGGEVVRKAIAAMREINAASRKIADIIGVIDEIAFQTNLLALNAAVEAARAGEQGRGFAVVASEVRNLAQRSAEAAKEIKSLIQDSVGKVNEGSRLVDDSGSTLEEIVESVSGVSQIISDIAAASAEQSEGIEQVNKAVAQMDQMTQQNAALTEETASASESNAKEAAKLMEMVAFFKTGGAREAAPPASDSAVAGPGGVERRGPGRPWADTASAARRDRAGGGVAGGPGTAAAVAPAAVQPDDDLEWAEF